MPSISDILLERGAAGANAISRRGNIYADLIRNLSSAPGQVTQQIRSDQIEDARAQEAQQRLGIAQQQANLQQQEYADTQAQRASQQRGQQALSTALQKHTSTDPETGHISVDNDAVYQDVSAVSPDIADHWYKGATDHLKTTNEIQNLNVEMAQKKAQLGANLSGSILDVPAEQRSAAYDAARTQALTVYANVPEIAGPWQKLPPVYSPALDTTLGTIRDSGTSQAQKAEAALKKAQAASVEATTAKTVAETGQIGKPKEMTPAEAARLKLDTAKFAFDQTEAQKRDAAKAAADAAAAAEKAKGKQLPAAEADKISDMRSALQDLKDLKDTLKPGSTGTMANLEAKYVPNAIAEYVPGAVDAQANQAAIDRSRQTIARMVHGGVLRANDQVQAEKFLPTLKDPEAVRNSKIDQMTKMIQQKIDEHVSNLGKTGWNVSGLDQPSSDAAPKSAAADPLGLFK